MHPLPIELIDWMRHAARDATIESARAFGFGGSTWSVARASGTGPAAREPTVLPGTVVLLAFRQAPAGVAGVAGGVPALADTWRAVLISGNVMPGDIVTSTADPRYQFGVATIEPWYEYARLELERSR